VSSSAAAWRRFLWVLLALFGSAQAHRPFLSFPQKGQLLWTGTITDAEGNRYNVRILPGYAPSFGFGTDSWGNGWGLEGRGVRNLGKALLDYPKSFQRLGEYFTAEPWDGIGEGFEQGVEMSKWATTDMMTAGAARDWHEYMADAAKTVDSLGYEHLWTWDHVKAIFGDPHQPIHEGWTTITAWAMATERVKIGLMVGANTFRNPALVAKIVTTLDHASGGRAILGIGGAWFELEHREFGLDFGRSPGERLNWLDESVGAIRTLTSGGKVTSPLEGRWTPASIDSSVVLPAPLGPISATSSPGSSSKLIAFSAVRAPKRLVSSRAASVVLS